MKQPQKQYPRFSLMQRAEHWILTLSFVLLAVTGLPQKFASQPWAAEIILALGGIEATRIIHRAAAIALMLQTIYHGVMVSYKVFVQSVSLSMVPGWKDTKDLLGTMAYNLGLKVFAFSCEVTESDITLKDRIGVIL